MLAAIVFTDVVGFSLLMGRDERGTLAAMERDFLGMEAISRAHQGLVMKRTGDGLLLRFASAVEAMEAAVEMQTFLREQAKGLHSADILDHRIGVHLGDVVVTETDVVGDGVNIAQRLQAEAKPGGICFSQTVYDVVKGKIKLQAINMGPKNLKHLIEPVIVWAVPPSVNEGLEGRRLTATPPLDLGIELPSTIPVPPSKGRGAATLMMLAVAVLTPVILLTFFFKSVKPKLDSNPSTTITRRSETPQSPVTQPEPDRVAEGTPDTPTPPETGDTPKSEQETVAEADTEATPQEVEKAIDELKEGRERLAELRKTYQFAEIASLLKQGTPGPSMDRVAKHYERLGELMAWFNGFLPTLTPESGLQLEAEYVWYEQGLIHSKTTEGVSSAMRVQDLPPNNLSNLLTAALPKSQEPRKMERLIQVFRREFSLSANP